MSSGAKILVLDDESGIRFFLEEALTRDGHEVTAVESGEAALKLLDAEDFDLALIDLKLKGMSGMEVLAELRKHSPDMAVIVLTGHASLETAVDALRHGAHDYLFKPCKTVQIRESVRTGLLKRQREKRRREVVSQLELILKGNRAAGGDKPTGDKSTVEMPGVSAPDATESPSEQGRFLQWGSLIVDLMRHVITLDGHLLELSPTEFDLLAYLVSEAPRVVSPQELVREVQGYESEPWEASDIVRYHVYRIRRKISEAAGTPEVIRTVRGVGYTIVKRQ